MGGTFFPRPSLQAGGPSHHEMRTGSPLILGMDSSYSKVTTSAQYFVTFSIHLIICKELDKKQDFFKKEMVLVSIGSLEVAFIIKPIVCKTDFGLRCI